MLRIIRHIILSTLLLSSIPLYASHIVGGELQMQYQRGESYLLRLILYYDQANAELNLVDQNIDIGIFRKVNDTKVDDTELTLTSTKLVNYANPNCLPDTLKTIKIIYEGVFRFNTEKYSHPDGYYITWERCCRNNIISNVFQPGRQGMVFMLEFPSMSKHFANSSPVFSNISGEYICRDRYIELDYSAKDADGDSLKYLLQTPMAGFTTPDRPQSNIQSGPYPLVEQYFIMPGNPFLQIDEQSGILKVRPTINGLFVFTVSCEEYRDGERIGAVNRDFQILVNDCEDNFPPKTSIYLQDGSPYNQGDTLFITNRNELCFGMKIVDNNPEEEIIYRVEPINYEGKSPIFSPPGGVINSPDDTLNVSICWPDCQESEDVDLFQFNLIIQDNACPVRNTDTILINLQVEEEVNSKPQLEFDTESIEWNVGNLFSRNIYAMDSDPDDSLDFSYSLISQNTGRPATQLLQSNFGNPIDGNFSLMANCDDLDESPYVYRFIVSDNSCAGNNSDSLDFAVSVNDYIPAEIIVEKPTNVITPNGDGLNEYFSFNRPPPSACEFQEFSEVIIYNRWGQKVFSSSERDFKWFGLEVPSGQYFYLIQFEQTEYKGYIHVIK